MEKMIMVDEKEENFYVANEGDVILVKRKAKDLAMEIGFKEPEAEEVSIAAIELSTNIVKHAQSGSIAITLINSEKHKGIQIVAKDKGPGLPDVELSMTDGFSTSNTMGCGLGAVNRLMDDLKITTDGKRKTVFTACKWLRNDGAKPGTVCPYDIGVATRPHPKMNVNGDSFFIKHWGNYTLAAIIDGVGHGQFANRAANTAKAYIENHFDQPFESMFTGTARACRATRGVVMAVSIFDWSSNKMRFASVGNIETKIKGNLNPINFNVRRGIVGLNMPKPMVNENVWEKDCLFIMQTDGISSRWEWKDVLRMGKQSATVISQNIIKNFSKPHDDATVIVIKDSEVENIG